MSECTIDTFPTPAGVRGLIKIPDPQNPFTGDYYTVSIGKIDIAPKSTLACAFDQMQQTARDRRPQCLKCTGCGAIFEKNRKR